MGIAVERLDVDRDVYAVSYPADEVQGDTITAKFHNEANGDKSTYAGSNDGEFIVTVGKGFEGTDNVTITGSDGGEVVGEVSFG